MAKLTILYWRDIPSQIVVKSGRKTEKVLLADKFQKAIDSAAMKSGSSETDDYLTEWRRGKPIECGDNLTAEAAKEVVRIENKYDMDHLRTLIANGGNEAS